MAKIYAELIRKGLKTIDDVPERIRAKVQEILKNLKSFNLKGRY